MGEPAGSHGKPGSVLVVEDEATIREIVRTHLELSGFHVEETADGSTALAHARETAYDLIVLDVMLPGLDGITVCRALRRDGANVDTPILMLTARDTESDTVVGLESGADDYVTKPFGVRELVARVNALLRRQRNRPPSAGDSTPLVVRTSGLELDAERRQTTVRGARVDLTKQEFDLLFLLASHPGIVYSREALLNSVWGGDTYVTDRTVDTVVSRLRKKVERDANDPELILTAWGVGYQFADAE